MNLRTKLWLMVITASFTGRGYTHVLLNQIGYQLVEEADKLATDSSRENVDERIQTLLDHTRNEHLVLNDKDCRHIYHLCTEDITKMV